MITMSVENLLWWSITPFYISQESWHFEILIDGFHKNGFSYKSSKIPEVIKKGRKIALWTLLYFGVRNISSHNLHIDSTTPTKRRAVKSHQLIIILRTSIRSDVLRRSQTMRLEAKWLERDLNKIYIAVLSLTLPFLLRFETSRAM